MWPQQLLTMSIIAALPVAVWAAAVINQQQPQQQPQFMVASIGDLQWTTQALDLSSWPNSCFWIVIGATALILMVSLGVWCWRRRRCNIGAAYRSAAPLGGAIKKNSKAAAPAWNKVTGTTVASEDFSAKSPHDLDRELSQRNNNYSNSMPFQQTQPPNNGQLLTATMGQRDAQKALQSPEANGRFEPVFRFNSANHPDIDDPNKARQSIISACTEADSIA